MSAHQSFKRYLDGLDYPPPADQRRNALVLRAYFDDSGTHAGSPAVVWAGFMAHVDEWTELEKEWAALLRREGLQTFHMCEIENGSGQCDLWPRARRDSVIHDFRQLLGRRNMIGVGASVRTADWADVVGGTWLEERLISPVFFAFEHAIQQALHWAEAAQIQTGIAEKVDFFFDHREEEAGKAMDLAWGYRRNARWDPWFEGAYTARMATCIPLQVADMLAYETYRLEKARAETGGDLDIRVHLERLLGDVPIHGQYYDRSALQVLAAQITENERPDLLSPQGMATG